MIPLESIFGGGRDGDLAKPVVDRLLRVAAQRSWEPIPQQARLLLQDSTFRERVQKATKDKEFLGLWQMAIKRARLDWASATPSLEKLQEATRLAIRTLTEKGWSHKRAKKWVGELSEESKRSCYDGPRLGGTGLVLFVHLRANGLPQEGRGEKERQGAGKCEDCWRRHGGNEDATSDDGREEG